jgi:hypothetical protein
MYIWPLVALKLEVGFASSVSSNAATAGEVEAGM